MSTATAEPQVEVAVETVAAPVASTPEVISPKTPLTLAEALDAALGTDGPAPLNKAATPKEPVVSAKKEKVIQPKPAEAVATKTPAPTESTTSKTPSSVLDQLGKLGLPEEIEPAKTEPEAPTEDITSPPAQTAFAKLTKELREAKSKLKEFESKVASRTEAVEESGKQVEDDSQLSEYTQKLEQFKKERDELEGELRITKLEATKEFKTGVVEPIAKASKEIADIFSSYELKATNVLEAASEPDAVKRRQLVKSLTSEIDPVDALAVRTKVEELAQLTAKKDELLSHSKEALSQITKRQEETERINRATYDSEAKKAFSEVWDKYQEDMPLLKKVEGNEEWNKTIEDMRLLAERLDTEPLDHRARASLTYQAVSLPLVMQVFKEYISKTNKEMASLKTNLTEYRKATPGAGSGQSTQKTQARDTSLSFLEALEKGL
jgi:predicted  nucleic acid-binding Zn-ribbon protein